MSKTYNYKKPVINTAEAMEILGYSSRDNFNHRVKKSGIEYEVGYGRRPSLFSMSNILDLAKMWGLNWVTIPDEYKQRAMLDSDVEPKAEAPQPTRTKSDVPYWERKAKALAEVYEMNFDEVLDEAVRAYLDKITAGGDR